MWITVLICVALTACGPSAQSGSDSGDDDDDDGCAGSATRCVGNTYETCVDGAFQPSEECPLVCDSLRGCVVCLPGTGTCRGEQAQVCRLDGSGYDAFVCDALQGMTCNVDTGLCDGDCTPQALGDSYIGCEYYPTVTGNMVSNSFDFAVAIANTSGEPADITIEGGALTAPRTVQVAAGDVLIERLPWLPELKLCTGFTSTDCLTAQTFGALAVGGAYRVRSTKPLTVYQFNPLDYTIGGGAEFSYTNDASLLLPTNAWTGNYLVAGWTRLDATAVPGGTWPSFIAVTAAVDNTQVTVNARFDTVAAGGAPAFIANVPQTVTLNRGDVLEIAAFGTFGTTPLDDLTGSFVTADQPVQVISGHYCAYVPGSLDVGYCDHLEESMFPIETLSSEYVVIAPAVPTLPAGKEQVVRFIATAPNTTLAFDPPQAGVATTLANPGDHIEVARVAADYVVSADEKILVVQYMEGQEAGGGTGDPAMALVVPTDQYRTEYLFHAPTNYEVNYVDIVAPAGTNVILDGTPVTGFTPLGSSQYTYARVQLGLGAAGNHTASGDQPFGITVYGYGQYTSYWYPGGLDLAEIPVP